MPHPEALSGLMINYHMFHCYLSGVHLKVPLSAYSVSVKIHGAEQFQAM